MPEYWLPAFTAYGMAVSDTKTYPIASSIINSGGNLGGLVARWLRVFYLIRPAALIVFTYFWYLRSNWPRSYSPR